MPFNVRVYGLLVNRKKEVLICDELFQGRKITKFPGGGLEFGEGTVEALRREMLEEAGTKVEVMEHFYTTDFFQVSAFNPDAQVISIYYFIKSAALLKIMTKTKPFDSKKIADGLIRFRWASISSISTTTFTFPIDKKVGALLKVKFRKR